MTPPAPRLTRRRLQGALGLAAAHKLLGAALPLKTAAAAASAAAASAAAAADPPAPAASPAPVAPLAPPAGRIRQLVPGGSLQAVLRQAADGDVIEIEGEHRGEVATIPHKRLTLRGIGRTRPVLHAGGRDAEGKAILVVRDGDIRIENIEFRGARVSDRNGAGIRFERGRLLVQRCAFFDNENGILTANFLDAQMRLEDCDFGQAPANTPLPHLIYVGRIGRFSMQGCRVFGGRQGHLVKSRAWVNEVLCNQLVDGLGGQAAYELEFPNGGIAQVVGNVIGQGAESSNLALLAFGVEGGAEPGREHALLLAHNTFINSGMRPALWLRVNHALGAIERATVNNLCVGLGAAELMLADPTLGNFSAPAQVLADADTGDYRLGRHSVLRGRGVAAPAVRGYALHPALEFTPPVGTRSLAPPARWSPGAYQS